MAYDGRDLELMTKGPDHEDYRRAPGASRRRDRSRLETADQGSGGDNVEAAGDSERGIEADQCYLFSQEKLAAAAKSRGSIDVTNLPNPDLVIEVDLSPSQIDRPGIYAAMGVAEVWRFDGKILTIHRLSSSGRYDEVEASVFVQIRPEQALRWLVDEDASDEVAWLERLASWLRNEWKKPS